MVTGPTRFRLALAVIIKMVVLPIIHRRIGALVILETGYYEYEVGSGQYFGGESPSFNLLWKRKCARWKRLVHASSEEYGIRVLLR